MSVLIRVSRCDSGTHGMCFSIANAFTKVVTSFVSDVALPVVSLLPFLNRNMDEKFAVLSSGPNYVRGEGYNTIKQARDDGALVLAYGCVYPIFFFSPPPHPNMNL